MQRQEPKLPYKIICDRVFYQRLQSIQDNESIKIYLFPFTNAEKKSLDFVILDITRCRANQDPKLKGFNIEEFSQICLSIYLGVQPIELLTFLFSKKAIVSLSSQHSQRVRIINTNKFSEVNRMLKQCVIITLKMPSAFYENQDSTYTLEGYKFNPIGKVRQNWGIVTNGRVTKGIFAPENQKVRTQQKENVVYSKNQLRKILELIQSVNTLTNHQDNKSKVFEELTLLGQNFIHNQKIITSSNNLLPLIHFQIELVCSLVRGQSCKNKVVSQNIKPSQHPIHNICLNYAQGITHCQKSVTSKVQTIFNKNTLNSFLSSSDSFCLTNMPTKLASPHLFLKAQFNSKFSQYYVKGLYEYYHYGDHNFNDQGWGCAYRSLETLLSWFRLHQKLNLLAIPTVPQIQNIIDLIDCTSQQKLSHTNTWIGATQVSWVVKKLTGYDCRILHIKDGKDIVEHAEMFRDHLENIGTPIMYGGDQYAYSIVGINYSWKLGEIMFCILDPHYNGSDKIEKIIEKKGICWRKPQQMFKKGVFYNFCLPIV